VAIGEMMNTKRKEELVKRREMEADFKAVVGDVFDVIGVFNSESHKARDARQAANRIAEIASRLGNVLGLSPNVCTEIYEYSKIHVDRTEDLSIEDYDDKEVLTERDYSVIREKTILGSVIIKRLQLNQKSEDIIRAHFEKTADKSFSDKMKQIQRSQEGQIILLAELYEILRQPRNYKTALTHKRALELLQLEFKTYFEPYILDRFIRYSSEFEDYYERNSVVPNPAFAS
jgi:response regulator RpfG family c-di-GMP phosphodiesterase